MTVVVIPMFAEKDLRVITLTVHVLIAVMLSPSMQDFTMKFYLLVNAIALLLKCDIALNNYKR